MPKGTRAPRGRQSAPAGFIELARRHRPPLLVMIFGSLVRARAELFCIALVIAAYLGFAALLPLLGLPGSAALFVLLALGVAFAVIPSTRRWVAARSWCVTDRHRLRACFMATRLMTFDGNVPTLVWARPSPVGERVHAWLPAGLSADDLSNRTSQLASACWARDVQVTQKRENASMVCLHVIRRDPLGERTPAVDLAEHVPEPTSDTGRVVPLPRREDVIVAGEPDRNQRTDQPVTDPPATAQRRNTTNQTGKNNQPEHTDETVIGFGGMDVSDYVD